MSDGILNFPFILFASITDSTSFCLRGRPIGLFTFCSSCGPSFFGRPGRLFGGVVSWNNTKSPGDLWASVPAARLVGVPSPDFLGLTLGDEPADFNDLAGEDDFLGEEADLDRGDEEADLDGGEADLDGEEDLDGGEEDLDGGKEADLDGGEPVLGGCEQAGGVDFILKVADSMLIRF